MTYISDTFLLTTDFSVRLFEEYAKEQPILDYHCHLPPKDVADNRRFRDLYEIWLEGDHYKWRAMRANGIAEDFVTGTADPFEKFMAWARTVPKTLRNPLYHWTHLELKRYFGIDTLLSEATAKEVWRQASDALQAPRLSAHGILDSFKVRALCTTDDPVDDLRHHRAIADQNIGTRVFPTFRPDKALAINLPDVFRPWLNALESVASVEIGSLKQLMDALDRRHQFFHKMGCRLSDHGLNHCYADDCPEPEASRIFEKALAGQAVDEQEQRLFASFLMLFFGQLDASRGWTKQLHLGALRNTNAVRFDRLGPDTGFDSIGDWPQVEPLRRYLDRLEQTQSLPRIVIYNLNPVNNYAFAAMTGNFQDGRTAGKIQFGSGWWYLDQKEGMTWQLNALSNIGLLSRFVGMLTDSRSFMSYPRHEYFRRILCDLLGSEMQRGELPDDLELVGSMVRDICYRNAEQYFELPL